VIRAAIAGLGSAAYRAHLPALAQLARDVTLVAAADPDADQRDEIAATIPGVPLFASAEEMLSRVECDVLIVATEPGSHAALVTLGMDHGLHVICEKPLTVSRAHHATIARACAQRPDLALVVLHQYRYSAQWVAMARWARVADRIHRPFSLTFAIERPGTDPHATSPWRANVAETGGMLADMGVHFLALAWTIHQRLDLMAAVRQLGDDGERSTAIYHVGSGVMTLSTFNGAETRRNHATLRVGSVMVSWLDDAAELVVGTRTLRRRSVPALTDRHYVDALYRPLYQEVVRNLHNQEWRSRRTAEALIIGEVLVELLERTPFDRPWAPASAI
jgi:predicted dehydrogenase